MIINDIEQLGRLNSMTKYPSILTYHQIGERGKLDDHIQVSFDDDEDVIVTEKVDGSNTRLIFLPGGDYIIGSREELLHAKGDRIWIPDGGIVDTIKEHDIITKTYGAMFSGPDLPFANAWVVFGEVFGGKTGQPKQYTGKRGTGFRVFDVMKLPKPLADDMVMGRDGWTRERLASWRQRGEQQYMKTSDLMYWFGSALVQLTPRLTTVKGKDLPKTHTETLQWLQPFAKTLCRLDDGAKAKSEGVVIRNENRTKIAKIRFEDYERTLRPQRIKGKN